MGKLTQNTVDFVASLVLKVVGAIAAIALLFAAGGSLFNPASLFSFKRSKNTLTIERTPMTVQDVRAVGKLVTASYYDEIIVKCNKKDLVRTNQGDKAGEMVIIQKAHARIGIDLEKLRDEDIQVQGDTSILIKLPPVECLHFIMNPSDTDIYSETKGNKGWSFEQLQEAMEPVKVELRKEVEASKVMDKARQGAEDLMTEFLTAFGFKHIVIKHTLPEVEVLDPETPSPAPKA